MTVPSVPTNVSIVLSSVYTYGSAGLTVSWNAPNDTGGSVITNYTASCTGGGLSSPATYTGMSTSFAVNGLSGGMSMTCSVKATNTKGDSIQATNSITPGNTKKDRKETKREREKDKERRRRERKKERGHEDMRT